MVLVAACLMLFQGAPRPLITGKANGGRVQIEGEGIEARVVVKADPFTATTKFATASIEFSPAPDGPCTIKLRARFGATGRPSEIRFNCGGTLYSVGSSHSDLILTKNKEEIVRTRGGNDWIALELAFNGASTVVRLNGQDVSTAASSTPPSGILAGCFGEVMGTQQEVDVDSISCSPMQVLVARSPVVASGTDRAKPMEATEIYKLAAQSIVTIWAFESNGRALGTGFMIAPDLIVTCKHVVHGALGFRLRTLDNLGFPGSIVWIREDPDADVALVKLETPVQIATLTLQPSTPEIGEAAYAIGNPLGMEGSLSTGIVSGVRKMDGITQVQFSCPVSPGNSGGPLLNSRGEVLGVVAWQYVNGQNLNFAIPASEVVKLLSMGG